VLKEPSVAHNIKTAAKGRTKRAISQYFSKFLSYWIYTQLYAHTHRCPNNTLS